MLENRVWIVLIFGPFHMVDIVIAIWLKVTLCEVGGQNDRN